MTRTKRHLLLFALFGMTSYPTWGSEYASELASELIAMAEADQQVRSTQPVDVAHVLSTDAAHSSRLSAIMAASGWPRVSVVGKPAADAAALLALHADRAPQVQRQALALMLPLLGSGEVDARKYAYLWDRTHSPQRYGTQGSCVGQRWYPDEIEEAPQVDSRRAAAGLGTLSEYVEAGSEMCAPAGAID